MSNISAPYTLLTGNYGVHLQHAETGTRLKVIQFVEATEENRKLPGALGAYLDHSGRVWWVVIYGVDEPLPHLLLMEAREWYLKHWSQVKAVLPLTPYHPHAPLVNVVDLQDGTFICLHDRSSRICRNRAELDVYLAERGWPLEGEVAQVADLASRTR